MIFVSQILAATGAWSLRLISHSLNHSSGRWSFQIIQTGDRIWGWIMNNEYSIKLTIIKMLPESQLIEYWMQLKDTTYKRNVQLQEERLNQHFSITWYPVALYNTFTFYMNILYENSIPSPLSRGCAFKCREDMSANLVSFYPKRNNSCMLWEFVGIDKNWTKLSIAKCEDDPINPASKCLKLSQIKVHALFSF